MATFDYIFEELPLVTVGNVDVCLINGEARIEYDSEGAWDISLILLEGFRGRERTYATAPEILHDLVLQRLYGSWRDKVDEAVRDQIEMDRIDAEEQRADDIRDRRVGG